MARPALIIGLGGTGQWVLTFLKKELLEIGGGTLPPEVKLLSFDTTSHTMAHTGQTSKQKKEEDIHLGAVRLVEGKEFIPIGDNVGPLVSEIAQGKHPHLQWFPAKSYLAKLPSAAFNTKEGSGQIRHMGRISIFRDVMSMTKSEILSRLQTSLHELQKNVSRDKQLEVIIVGSLAGGTGAGMLVDMAVLVRAQAAKMVQENYIIRGFFVLPRAFLAGGLGEGQDMMARAFAAWRELDRFMLVSERFGLRQMNYHETNPDLRPRLMKRVYDVSYMIDPARPAVNSLDNMKPEEGLFPAIAHIISAIVDEKAGQAYTEFVTTNLAGKLAQLPRKPYHSAIGCYTLKVPVYYAETHFSHQLALDVLKHFLAPQINEKGRVIGVSELANREVPEGHVEVQAALRFMASSGINIGGQDIPNTRFLPLVAEIREKDGVRNNAMVQQIARGGLTVGASRYLQALTDISQDEEGKLILREIQDELNHPIWRDVAPSHQAGDTPAAAFTRIKNRVPAVRQEHYGLDTTSGERLRGKYGKALERAKQAQVARFRRLFRAYILHALNGDSSDPRLARSGKIGYVRAFCRGVIDNFDYFVRFLNLVRQTRNEELRLAAKTRQAADAALREYERLCNKKCWLTFWDDFTHPDAHRAQRNYLLAEQRDIDVRKDDILLDVLAETAIEMRAFAEQTLKEVEKWIVYLAVGDPSINVNGLYADLLESLDNLKANHELDKRLKKVSNLVGEHEYRTEEAFVTEALGRLRWNVEETPQGLKLECGIDLPADNPDEPSRFEAFRCEGDNPSAHNLALILKLAHRPFQSIYKERPLAKEVMRVYPTGAKLAEAVDKMAEPFYVPAPSTVRGPEVVACYIRVHSNLDDSTTTYFGEFEKEMKERNAQLKGSNLTLVDSQDPYKMTIIRSDDLIPSEDFQMWHACREAYIQQVTDPRRDTPASELHIFPAEINACQYEAEIPRILGQNYRTLHPEVVSLLEDKDKFEMFLRAYALGFIRVLESDDGPYWAYQLPDDKEPLYLSVPTKSISATKEDIFQVIHNFVMEGVDQRPGMNQYRYVDWDRLLDAILKAQRELGKSKVIQAYQAQIDSPNGLISMIKTEIERRKGLVRDEALRTVAGQEFVDLADLIKLVYLKAIRSIEEVH